MAKNTRCHNRLLARGTACLWRRVEVGNVHAREWAKAAMPDNFATLITSTTG